MGRRKPGDRGFRLDFKDLNVALRGCHRDEPPIGGPIQRAREPEVDFRAEGALVRPLAHLVDSDLSPRRRCEPAAPWIEVPVNACWTVEVFDQDGALQVPDLKTAPAMESPAGRPPSVEAHRDLIRSGVSAERSLHPLLLEVKHHEPRTWLDRDHPAARGVECERAGTRGDVEHSPSPTEAEHVSVRFSDQIEGKAEDPASRSYEDLASVRFKGPGGSPNEMFAEGRFIQMDQIPESPRGHEDPTSRMDHGDMASAAWRRAKAPEHAPLAPRFHFPKDDFSPHRRQPAAVAAECDRLAGRIGGQEQVTPPWIPEALRAIPACGCEEPTCGAEGDAAHGAEVAIQRPEAVAGPRVPEADLLTFRDRGDEATIMAPLGVEGGERKLDGDSPIPAVEI